MEESLKFNSQVCTNIKQSQRLLELGLNPETADMAWVCVTKEGLTQWVMTLNTPKNEPNIDIPAWSLHRVMELLPQDIHLDDYVDTYYYLTINPFKVIYVNSHRSWIYQRDEGCLYDKLIGMIEWTIRNNFFNKEYLKQ